MAQPGALLRLLEAIGFSLNADDLGIVHQPVNQRDDTGGVREHLTPFSKGSIRISYLELILVLA